MKSFFLSVSALACLSGYATGHDMQEFYQIYSGMTGIPAQFSNEKLRDILGFTATMKGQDRQGGSFQGMARMLLVVNNYEKIRKIEDPGAFDPWSQEIITFVKSGDEERTLKLLTSGEPVKRWIALKKVKELELLTKAEIANRVKDIFDNDPHILVGRQWREPVKGQPDPGTDNYVEVFIAKLREEAADLLGETLDNEKVSADGLTQMKRYVEEQPQEKLVMTDLLLQMEPVDRKMKEAQSSIRKGTFWSSEKEE